MAIVHLSSIRKQHRILIAFFLLVFCTLPFQHRINSFFKPLAKSIIPVDLQLPPYFSKSIYLYVTDPILLLFVGFVFLYFRPSVRSFFWEGPSKLLSLFFFTAVVSIFLSKSAHYPLQYIRLLHFSLGIILFDGIVSLRHRLDLSFLVQTFAGVVLAVGLLEGSLAICQYFTQSSLGLHFLGEMSLTHFCFPSEGSPLYLGGVPSSSESLCRASGTFSHPNILAAFLFCSLISTCFLYVKKSGSLFKIGLILALGLQVLALFTSFSRSGFLAFVCGFVFFLLCLFKSRCFKPALSLFSAVLVFCSGCIVLLSPALLSRGGILNYNELVQGADLERIQYSKMATEMVRENPFFGVGFNNFQLYSQSIQEALPGSVFHSKVHNIYLLIASETGLIGGGLFLLFVLSILIPACKKSSSPLFIEKIFLLAAFLGFLLIGCFDFFFIDVSAASLLFFGVAALLYAVSLKTLEKKRS